MRFKTGYGLQECVWALLGADARDDGDAKAGGTD